MKNTVARDKRYVNRRVRCHCNHNGKIQKTVRRGELSVSFNSILPRRGEGKY